jgi:hypothetical protein
MLVNLWLRDILTPFIQVHTHKIIMPQNPDYQNITSENQAIPGATEDNTYKKRLNGWAVARIVTAQEKVIVSRFRSRADAEGYIQHIRQMIPNTVFELFFDCQREEVVM